MKRSGLVGSNRSAAHARSGRRFARLSRVACLVITAAVLLLKPGLVLALGGPRLEYPGQLLCDFDPLG